MARATSNILPTKSSGLLGSPNGGGFGIGGNSNGPVLSNINNSNKGIASGTSIGSGGVVNNANDPLSKILGVALPASPQQGLLSSAFSSISSPVKSITHTSGDGTTIKVDTHAPQSDTSASPKSTVSQTVQATQQNPAYQTGGNPNASPSLVGQQSVQGNSSANYPTLDNNGNYKAPVPLPKPTDTSFPGLINAGTNAFDQSQQVGLEAAQLRQAIAREKQDVLGNPFYSGAVKIGQSGIIDQNQGSQLQALVDQQKAFQGAGTGYNALAGTASPTTQFGVLTNPQNGQPISGGSAGSAAFNGGVIGGQQAAGQTYAGLAVANNAAKGVKATLDDFISKNPTVNSSPLSLANGIKQWALGQQLSDPQTQTFLNDVQEYVSTLAPILGIGGAPTDAKTFIANSFVNPLASGQSIQQVLQGVETLANNKLAYYATAASGGNQNPQITSQSGASSGSVYDF